MIIKMKRNGYNLTYNTETGAIHGDTYPVRDYLKKYLEAKWNPTTKAWVVGNHILEYHQVKEMIADAQKAEEKEKAAVVEEATEAIEGLKELEAAANEQEQYHDTVNKMMDDENESASIPAAPQNRVKEIAEKNPKAAAYKKAQNWSYASNYTKAGLGQKAMKRIEAEEDHSIVIAEMEAAWSAYAMEYVD